MKNLCLILLFISFNYAVFGQTVTGVVLDKSSKEALIGVNIILEDGSGTATDIFGKYTLKAKNGTNTITFKYIGYENEIKKITLQENEEKTVNINLNSSSEILNTVVISAGKFEQKLEEITVSMEVIKPSLIENKNTTDIQTAMDQVPGVNITDGQANIRGGSGWSYGAGTRVSVLVDDMPLISGDAGQVQWKLIATENINQVEVIKGASSALYGSSALNGIINIRTAFPSQKDIDKHKLPGYTKINMHYGLIDNAKREVLNWRGERGVFRGIEFLHAMKIDNLDLSLGGNIFKDNGYRLDEITDRKRFNLNSTYKSKKVKGLSFGLNANFLFQSTGSALIWNSLDEAYIPLDSAITTTNGDTYNIDPSITYMKGNNKHTLRTRYLKVINDNSTKGKDEDQDNASKTFYSDYQWQKNIKKNDLIFTVGTTNEIVYARAALFNGKNNRINNALYTQIDKKYGRLNLSLGARYESFQLKSDKTHVINGDTINSFSAARPIFRTGLNYQLAEATYIRTSWGQGYRFPSMAELFISTEVAGGIEVYPNPELKPESGWSAEIGIKQGLKAGTWAGYLDIAAFLMQYDDMMEFTFGQWGEDNGDANFYGLGFKSVNIGNTQISGVEVSLSGQGKINNNTTINLLAGYTYMNPISLTPNDVYESYEDSTIIEVYLVGSDGEYLPGEWISDITYNNSSSDPSVLKYRYKHLAKIDAELIYKRLSLGSSVRYNDFMKNIDAIFTDRTINEGFGPIEAVIPGINEARDKFLNGDIIIDARMGYQLNDILRVGFVVNNVLNREYMTRPANMMPPRTFALQCNLKI